MITQKFHESKRAIHGQLTEQVATIKEFESRFELTESKNDSDKREKLVVVMEAIHVGKTRNGTYYTEAGLKNGIDSWTKPYNKPVLTHHNSRTGEPIGRILSAKFESSTMSGRPGLVFEVEISDPTAIEKVKDGRYSTVSIGGYTDSVVCNCCGTNRMDEWCEHYPGDVYDGQECHFIIGTTFGEEVSYVNTPADINAGNIAVSTVSESAAVVTEDDVEDEGRPQGVAGIAASADAGVDEDDLEQGKTEEGADGVKDDAATDEAKQPVVEEGTSSPEEEPEAGKTVEESNGEPPSSSENGLENGNADDSADKPEGAQRAGVAEGADEASLSELVQLRVDKGLLEQENDSLRSKVASLEAEVKESVAKEVIELKKKLGRHDILGVEENVLVQEHTKRSIDSLKDTRADLLAESLRESRSQKIENPALAGSVKEGKQADEDKNKAPEKASGLKIVSDLTNALSFKRR